MRKMRRDRGYGKATTRHNGQRIELFLTSLREASAATAVSSFWPVNR